METSRFEVAPDASEAEVAAIAAALSAYLADGEDTAGDGEPEWDGRRWRFAGRLSALGRGAKRAPAGAPTDPWRATGRSDRFPHR